MRGDISRRELLSRSQSRKDLSLGGAEIGGHIGGPRGPPQEREIPRCECMRFCRDQRVHGNPATLVTPSASISGSKFISRPKNGQQEITMKALLNPWIARLTALLRDLGPYAAIELLLPGRSVIALLISLYRHRSNDG